MAVGADMKLRSPLQQPLNPQAASPRAPHNSFAGAAAPPPAIGDRTIQSAVNNQLASGYGAREMSLKGSDRQGVSRGRAQQYYANIAQEDADATAEAGAAKLQMGASAANAAARQQYESAMRNEQLTYSGLLEGLRNASQMERFGGMANRQAIEQAMRRGQFGLDSLGLDYSPILRGLLD